MSLYSAFKLAVQCHLNKPEALRMVAGCVDAVAHNIHTSDPIKRRLIQISVEVDNIADEVAARRH